MLTGTCLSGSSTYPIYLKDVLSFELSSIPYSLTKGSHRKGVYEQLLCSVLEKDIHVVQQLTASTNPKVVIINGMAVLHITKFCGADTFGELFKKYFNIFTAPLFYNNGLQVHMVFDQYSNWRFCHSSTRTMGKIYC